MLDAERPESIEDVSPRLGEPTLLAHRLHKLIEVVLAKQDLVQGPPIPVLQVWTARPIRLERHPNGAIPQQGKHQNAERTGAMFSLPAMDQHFLPKHERQHD